MEYIDISERSEGHTSKKPGVVLFYYHRLGGKGGLLFLYSYQEGFMHEKVMLIDNTVAAVVTANYDNRSIQLNFDITTIVINDEYDNKPYWFKLAVSAARLTATVLLNTHQERGLKNEC